MRADQDNGNPANYDTPEFSEEGDAQFLSRLGCEFGQGYFFSPALDAQGVLDYIARHYNITATTEPG